MCEKCLRTKLVLLCANRLGLTKVFKKNDLTVGLVLKGFTVTDVSTQFCCELIRGLRKSGYKNLARAVMVKRWKYYSERIVNIRGTFAWIDKNILRGMVKHWSHTVNNLTKQPSS